jgi:hypothetical protein
MTTPGPDSFQYNDDSVVARVSFDVPPSTLTDITQITQAMSAMRTELESIARAQSNWIDYLQQVPQIAERANQAYRDSITQMERIAYIQNEIGGSGAIGGGSGASAGSATGGGGGGSAGGGYSTAAPAGYMPLFDGMTEGMGIGRGRPADGGGGHIGALGALPDENPRMAANMAAARGVAVNPTLLGMVGGAMGWAFGQDTGGGPGKGNEAPGDMGPQTTGADRTASGPPNPSQGGAPVGSQPTNAPGPASADDPWWRKTLDRVNSEGRISGRISNILGKIPPTVLGDAFKRIGGSADPTDPDGDGVPSGPASGSGMLGGLMGMLPGPLSGMLTSGATKAALKGAGAAGLAIGGYNIAQDVGERMTALNKIGSEQGGDWVTGLKEDLKARIGGLDPFVNTDQVRQATQIAMSAGLQGDSRQQLQDMMLSNFKELGIAFGDSAKLALTNIRGQELTDENMLKTRSATDATVNVMKELAGDGGNSMALSERIKQLTELTTSLNALGISQQSIDRGTIAMQEGYEDSPAVRGDLPRITSQAMNSNNLLAIVGSRVGVTDAVPGAMGLALEQAGYDHDEIIEMAAQEAAKIASQEPKYYNQIGVFRSMMASMDVDLDIPQATEMYEKYAPGSKKQKAVAKGNEAVAAKGEKNKQTNWNPFSYVGDVLSPMMNAKSLDDFKNIPGDMLDAIRGYHEPSQNAENTVNSFERAGRLPNDNFAPSGQRGRQLPQSAQQTQPSSITTRGSVTGEVRITVDQQGRVTAPSAIQLSGTQKAVNAGIGSSTLNAAPFPSDYAAQSFPGGGSG